MSKNFVEIKDSAKENEHPNLKKQLIEKLRELNSPNDATPLPRARLQLDVAEILVALERKAEAWTLAREAFDIALLHDAWKDAVEACDVLYLCEQADSLAVLGMGVWLAVSFPVDTELTLAMMMHIVEETPNHSDGAALAAVTARYVVDLRAEDEVHESLGFLANTLIGRVAERHSNVRDQIALDKWMDSLQLRDPQVFLPRMGKVVDIIVGDKWWFDRDTLRNKFD
jgi:hypothetical protein